MHEIAICAATVEKDAGSGCLQKMEKKDNRDTESLMMHENAAYTDTEDADGGVQCRKNLQKGLTCYNCKHSLDSVRLL